MTYQFPEFDVGQLSYKGRNIIIIKQPECLFRAQVYVTFADAEDSMNYVLPSFETIEHAKRYIDND